MRLLRTGLSMVLLGVALTLVSVSPAPAGPLTVYVVPFAAGTAPPALAEALFDGFIDQLDRQGGAQGVGVTILKQPLAEIDAAWLVQKTSVGGDVLDYVEDSGCCYTQFQVRARVVIHLPGNAAPITLEQIDEGFFNHDLAKLADEQLVVGDRLGRTLAMQTLKQLAR